MKLVQEYIDCMDEVSQIYNISERKIEFLERLKQAFTVLAEPPNVANDQRSPRSAIDKHTRDLVSQRIDGAIRGIQANHEHLPGILQDLRNSLDDVSILMHLS